MQYNPNTCEPKDAPMTPEEYAEWERGYLQFLEMTQNQYARVMFEGENVISEPKQFDW